jgi:hypothetical protein
VLVLFEIFLLVLALVSISVWFWFCFGFDLFCFVETVLHSCFSSSGRDLWVLVTEQLPSTKLHGQGMAIFKDLEDLKSEISEWWGKNKAVEILSYGNIDGENQMVMISHQVCCHSLFIVLILKLSIQLLFLLILFCFRLY